MYGDFDTRVRDKEKKRGKKFKIARESSLTEEEEKSLKTERGRKEGRKIGRKKGEIS